MRLITTAGLLIIMFQFMPPLFVMRCNVVTSDFVMVQKP
jgi:hypothetical protein